VFLVKFIIAVKYRFLGLAEHVARMGKKINCKEEIREGLHVDGRKILKLVLKKQNGNSFGSRLGKLSAVGKHINKSSGYIKCGEILDRLDNKKCSRNSAQ
jgi:hypothetical protein